MKAGIVALSLTVVAGCHHLPLGEPVRKTPPLPPAIAGRLRPSRPGRDLRLELLEENALYRKYLLTFTSEVPGGDEGQDTTLHPVRGEYYQLATATKENPSPLIQISPILGGAGDDYLASRVFAGWALRQGYSSFFLHQENTILATDRSGEDLERLMRKTTVENIQAIHLLEKRPELDGRRLGSFGISLGAIKNVLLIAAEPRLQANVLCLAGGDLSLIVRDSREGMVLDYVRRRIEREGITRQDIVRDLAENLESDPIRVARYVDPQRVLLFLGSLDDKVPYARGLALHRALGRPELHVFPVGHYTGIVAAPRTARLGFDWMRERFKRGEVSRDVEGRPADGGS